MSKRDAPARVKLSDFKERKELEGAIDIEMDDGQVFRIPPPELWSDKVNDHQKSQDLVAMCRAIMGDEQYEAFVAAGGSAALMNSIYADVNGITPGE